MNRRFNIFYGLSSSVAALSVFLTVPALASEKYPEKTDERRGRAIVQDQIDDEDYPERLPKWILPHQAWEQDLHMEKAKGLNAVELLSKAETLIKEGNTNSFFYLLPLIENKSCLIFFRDRAVTHYLKLSLSLLQINSGISLKNGSSLLKNITKCARILSRKPSARPCDRACAEVLFGCLHSPVAGLGIFYEALREPFKFPVKAEKHLKHALTYPELEPKWRAMALNELGALYLNGHLGTGDKANLEALKFYKELFLDESLAIELRLQACIDQMLALQDLDSPRETFEERRRLISFVKAHPETSPEQLKTISIDDAVLDLEEATYVSSVEKKKVLFESAVEKLEAHLRDSSFSPQVAQLRDVTYAHAVSSLIFNYGYPKDRLGGCIEMLGEIIKYGQDVNKTTWINAVLYMANVIALTRNLHAKVLGTRNINSLLDEIRKSPDVPELVRLEASSSKAVLAARGLIGSKIKEKNEIFKELINLLDNPMTPAQNRLDLLIVFAQEVQKFYPTYNPRIKQVTDRLKNALEDEPNLLIRQKIEFILLYYYLRYPKCGVKDQEAVKYAQDLSEENVPDQLRIQIINPTVETEPATIEPVENAEVSVVSPAPEAAPWTAEEPEAAPQKGPTPPQRNKPDNVVYGYNLLKDGPEKGVKEERNIKDAELLLERLQSRRGKVTQSEVTNMLRRLDYAFEPTQDEGLTVHPTHKGKGNKKGGKNIKGGARRDLRKAVEDAIAKKEAK